MYFKKSQLGGDNPITKLDNVILMPHSGSATVETRKDMAEIAVKNLVLALSGKKPIYQVKI